MTRCRESRTKLEENVETLRKTHTELLHSRDKCALDIKVQQRLLLPVYYVVTEAQYWHWEL